VLVASTDDGNVQNVLSGRIRPGIVGSSNFAQVRRIINARLDRRYDKNGRDKSKPLTVSTLRKDNFRMTRTKDSFGARGQAKETASSRCCWDQYLWRDDDLKALLQKENLMIRPELTGEYSYES